MEDSDCNNKVESVVCCHVDDAITFWAQNINMQKKMAKISFALASICPQASPVFGSPDLSKIYGGCFSEDRCWYRCKILQVVSDEKCQVLYVDYGNSEILVQSEIVEIPENLQFPSVAKKYRLWGLQMLVNHDVNQFDQGRKFLSSLITSKEMKARYKATAQDGAILVHAECGLLDVGEEIAKKGFAKRCTSSTNMDVEKDFSPYRFTMNANSPALNTLVKGRVSANSPVKGGFGDFPVFQNRSDENDNGNRVPLTNWEKTTPPGFRRLSNTSLDKMKQHQKLIEEIEKLNEEKQAIREENKKLESKIQELSNDLEEEKKAYKDYLEDVLPTYVGTTVRNLAGKFEKLKEARQRNMGTRFGEDLSEAVKVVREGCLVAPLSLEKLEKIWIDCNFAQEEIRLCKDVDNVQCLILHRNETQQKLYSAIEEFIIEVNDLPVLERLEVLKTLQESLESAYGYAHHEAESSEDTFEKFFEWKNGKLEEFNQVRNATEASLQNLVMGFKKIFQFFDMNEDTLLKYEDIAMDVDEVLKKADMDISQELDLFLTEPDETDKKIILNVYVEVMRKVHQEQQLLYTVYHKHLESIEFKKQLMEWLDKSPNIDNLLLIKKRIKSLKSQLRWKMAEKIYLEESDDYSEPTVRKIKEEITELRNSIFQEISKEQEEYEMLTHLVQTCFPELPLLHPEAGILKYMNSGGLLTFSLERDLLDAEPMKELSTKRPMVCSEVQGQKVILKGYAVDISTETEIIETAAKYHKVWREMKEESGLMQLMFLFLCKSDPVAYLMVPYYGGASLGIVQTTAPLTPDESLKVMKGVARGLHALHSADIVHGSLHKNNVFAVNRIQGIVGDFDFSKSEDQRAAMNSVALNDYNLISPEVKNGQPPSPASDMFAFGCLLCWLFFGNQECKINRDGIPEVDGLIMDDKVKSLLSNLLCSNNRMTAEQVLNDDCFLLPEMISLPQENGQAECGNENARTEDTEIAVPLEHEQAECGNEGAIREVTEVVSEDKQDSEIVASETRTQSVNSD
ncbi:serine/threonine-protein kinase 31 [Anolis carolinensis]|uniref:Serine/threonine kinase 31 n=1 Tax=Anolis carolinensis TaxID=28377 RepID=G1KNT3_ANOCA|nr:PREDICTED: serine/threonine-protein kinase 31 [Anolis carolinensis]|eukprot:XP_003222199.1 PREDICTED: serine/threonine-protein kinase 31 [Anolis carolinensis]